MSSPASRIRAAARTARSLRAPVLARELERIAEDLELCDVCGKSPAPYMGERGAPLCLECRRRERDGRLEPASLGGAFLTARQRDAEAFARYLEDVLPYAGEIDSATGAIRWTEGRPP